MSTALILQAADFIGVVSFALSGFLTGFRHKLDIFGITLLAFLTALGGGIARDVIVGRIPVSMQDLSLCLIVLATLALSIALKLHKKTELDQKLIFVISDAVGLAATSITFGPTSISTFGTPAEARLACSWACMACWPLASGLAGIGLCHRRWGARFACGVGSCAV